VKKARGLEAMRAQRERTRARLAALGPDDWDLACLPRWAVRDVVAHLIASDQSSVTGAIARPLFGSADRSVIERWNDQAVLRWRDRSPEELVDALLRWGRRAERLGRLVPTPLSKLPVGTPYGRQPLAFLLYLRVWDEWVHEQDICWALGAPRGDVPAPPPLPIAEVLAGMVLAVLPRKRLPEVARRVGVVRLVVDPSPPEGAATGRPAVWAADFARRQYGPRVTAKPEAEIRVHAAALALLLANRLGWRDLDDRWIAVEGDTDLAAALLDAVPMPSGESPAA
jgi:uncharacterized protein (TIGR03083 family)